MLIDGQLDKILAVISKASRVAISSDPGSGKSTRIPPSLMEKGYRVLVLEPRRISALSLATYISETRGTPLGDPIGYQVRGEAKRSARTQVLFATEALLAKYLVSDPDLSAWDVVVLDEFHERHLHTDLAWALLNQIQRELRPDLKIVLLSATLNLSEVRRSWPDVADLHIENPPHPLEILYLESPKMASDFRALREHVVRAITSVRRRGDTLVFLPGHGEIQRVREDLLSKPLAREAQILELYGSQNLGDQRAVLKRGDKPKIILATNIAESSITIDGVHTVIDAGLERVAWGNTKSGLTELKTGRISKSSATQRAGRAARQGPGLCYRLWTEAEQSAMEDFALAEIHRSDLSEALMEIFAAGWNPTATNFAWFENPPRARLEESFKRLQTLKLVDESHRLRARSSAFSEYPTGLRGSLYLSALEESETKITALDCAVAAWISSPEGRTTQDFNYQRDAEAVAKYFRISFSFPRPSDSIVLGKTQLEALLGAIPDRLFERRSAESASVKLSSGRGATVERDPILDREKYGVAILLRETDPDVRISLFLPLEKSAFQKHVARETIPSAPTAKKMPVASDIFAPPFEHVNHLLKRAAIFRAHCDQSFDLAPVLESAAQALIESQPKLDLNLIERQGEIISWAQGMSDAQTWARFERACPTHYTTPHTTPRGARHVELHYIDPTRVELHTRLQNFLNVTEHPTIAEGHLALTLVLLSPAMRPIQITQRLQDFWTGSYPQIKKEMKSRYPKHDW